MFRNGWDTPHNRYLFRSFKICIGLFLSLFTFHNKKKLQTYMYTLNFNPITCNHFLRKKNVTEYNWISFVIPKSWLLSIFYLHTLICIVNINRSIFFIYFNVVLWYGSSVLGKKSTCNFLVSWSFITCSSCILVNFRLLPTMQKITRNKSFVSFFPLKWIP